MSTSPALPIVYIDMDGVIVDFQTGIDKVDPQIIDEYGDDLDDIPGIFGLMEPRPGAIEAVNAIWDSGKYDVYILSTAPWDNPTAWSDKIAWVHQHFGQHKDAPLHKRLVLSHNKHLNRGDYLIDDRKANGASEFEGEHIHFGPDGDYADWPDVLAKLGVALPNG